MGRSTTSDCPHIGYKDRETQPTVSPLNPIHQKLGNNHLQHSSQTPVITTPLHSSNLQTPLEGDSDLAILPSEKEKSKTTMDVGRYPSERSTYDKDNSLVDADTGMKKKGSKDVFQTECQLRGSNGENACTSVEGLEESLVVCGCCKNAQAKVRLQPCEHELCNKCAGGSGRCVECGALILYYESLN